jgi:hypothetical protein
MNPVPPSIIQPEQSPARPALNTALPSWTQLPAERQRELVMSLAAMLVKRLATSQLDQEVKDD